MEKTSENPQQIETQDNKNDKNKATPAYTQQQLEANTQIKGFLAIYLLTAIIGVVYSLFLGLKAYNIYRRRPIEQYCNCKYIYHLYALLHRSLYHLCLHQTQG